MLILNSFFKAKYKRVMLDSKNVIQVEEHPEGYCVVYTESGGNIISHCVKEPFETILNLL